MSKLTLRNELGEFLYECTVVKFAETARQAIEETQVSTEDGKAVIARIVGTAIICRMHPDRAKHMTREQMMDEISALMDATMELADKYPAQNKEEAGEEEGE